MKKLTDFFAFIDEHDRAISTLAFSAAMSLVAIIATAIFIKVLFL